MWFRQIWAVALLAIRESSRRRVYWILVLYAGLLLTVYSLVPPSEEPGAPLRLLQLWVFRGMGLFTAITAIFLAGFSLPGEIERRQIYVLATKPISRVTLLLGKYLGYGLVIAGMILAMGVVADLILRGVQLLSSEPFALEAYPIIRPQLFGGTGARPEGDSYVVNRNNPDGFLSFHFKGLDPWDFPLVLKGRLNLMVGTYDRPFDLSQSVRLRATNPATGETFETECHEVMQNEWYPVELPRSLITNDGELRVTVSLLEPNGWLILRVPRVQKDEAGFQLFGKPSLFEWNLFLALVLVIAGGLFLSTLTITASTYLGGATCAFVAIAFWGVGMGNSFLTRAITDQVQLLEQWEADPRPAERPIPPWIHRPSLAVSRIVLKILPDLGALLPSDDILEDRKIRGKRMWQSVAPVALWCAGLAGIGIVLFLLRDFT